jgi:hypothetical protein
MAAAYTTLSVLLSSDTLKKGDKFTASIMVDSRTAIRGVQWALSFNPQTMHYESASEGNFFKDWAAANNCTTLVFPEIKVDNSNGQIADLGVAIMGSHPGGVTGNGTLFSYQFTALADNPPAPILQRVILSDQNGGTLQAKISGSN